MNVFFYNVFLVLLWPLGGFRISLATDINFNGMEMVLQLLPTSTLNGSLFNGLININFRRPSRVRKRACAKFKISIWLRYSFASSSWAKRKLSRLAIAKRRLINKSLPKNTRKQRFNSSCSRQKRRLNLKEWDEFVFDVVREMIMIHPTFLYKIRCRASSTYTLLYFELLV